jgi:hypothetical protein
MLMFIERGLVTSTTPFKSLLNRLPGCCQKVQGVGRSLWVSPSNADTAP